MRLTITPRDPDAEPLKFWAPDNGGHVRIETDDRPGALGRQICHGGGFVGEAVWVVCPDDFIGQCRRWYRAMRRRTAI